MELPTARQMYNNTIEYMKDAVRAEIYNKISEASKGSFSVTIANLQAYPNWLLHELLAKGYFVDADTISWEVNNQQNGLYYYQTDAVSNMYPYKFASLEKCEEDTKNSPEKCDTLEEVLEGVENLVQLAEAEPEPKPAKKGKRHVVKK